MNEEDIQKGLKALNNATNGDSNVVARRNSLFQKAQNGTISPEENDELVKSLSGSGLVTAVNAGLTTDSINKSQAVDVSGFLRDITQGVGEGLRVLTETMQKGQVDDHGFRVALATTLGGMFEFQQHLNKSLNAISEKLGVVMAQPARAPRSQGVRTGAQPINKSMAGANAGGGQPVDNGGNGLSKEQVLDVMESMHKSGVHQLPHGEDMNKAISRYEGTNELHPATVKAVLAFHQKMAH